MMVEGVWCLSGPVLDVGSEPDKAYLGVLDYDAEC